MKEILAIQQRLKELGYYTIKVDGINGPGTRNAIIDFTTANGLTFFDEAKLFDEDAKSKPRPEPQAGAPSWIKEAYRLLGTLETPGLGNTRIIMDWAKDLDQWYPGDDVPWCGLFMAHCMNYGAPDEPQDFNRLGAREWRKFGVKVEPSAGAIAVFWREHKTTSFKGHVAFLLGEHDDDTLVILGGNQSDAVSITKIAKDRLLECRAPASWTPLPIKQMQLEGVLSRDEE